LKANPLNIFQENNFSIKIFFLKYCEHHKRRSEGEVERGPSRGSGIKGKVKERRLSQKKKSSRDGKLFFFGRCTE